MEAAADLRCDRRQTCDVWDPHHVTPPLQTPLGRLVSRRAAAAVDEALGDTRVVLINGARQCGKTTLARQVGARRGMTWRSLDKSVLREAAVRSPDDFIADAELLVIDEVQRAPELLLAIKESVDRDPRPGRYLLTGSVRLLGLRTVPDLLPGRIETIELWPMSQGEIDDQPDGFVDAVFAEGGALTHETDESRSSYIARLARGGFPEALARPERRRQRFHREYVGDLINRDVVQISEIERGPEMRALIAMLAARSGQLVVPHALANSLGLSQETVRRYLAMLEEVFLIKRVRAWSRNLSSRAVGTAKVAMVDSGLATSLTRQTEASLSDPTSPLGGLLEAFAAMEIARQLTWSEEQVEMFHYRTRDQVEVDLVLENDRGKVVALDVKASSTVRADDFKGLRHLADRLGDDLLVGLVLYTGPSTVSFGPRLKAMPLSAIWAVGRR